MTAYDHAATIEALPYALRGMRHLYEQLLVGRIGVQAAAATGLLGPAIEKVERVEAAIADLRAQLAAMTKERDEARMRVLRPLSPAEIEAALHEGRAEAMAATGDNAWTSLLKQRDTARAERDAMRKGLEEMRSNWARYDRRIEADINALLTKATP